MAISRRRFITSGTLAAIAAGVALNPRSLVFGQRSTQGTSLGYQIPLTAQKDSTYMFTRATFEPYVGGIFQAPDARGRMVSLTLLSATSNQPTTTALKVSSGKAIQTDGFSLMFKAERALPPFTSIHQISHPALGKFDLFLTPRLKDGTYYYEAVFNHI